MIRGAVFGLLLLSGCAASTPPSAAEDPFLWLEEIESPAALDWARARNEKSMRLLAQSPRYAAVESELRAILLARDRIPEPSLHGGWVYNFWQDPQHVRGLWRRARLIQYENEAPAWETVLDVDELARRENENWVWKGAGLLPPEGERALVRLSRGGKDASVVREYDLPARAFVEGGFSLPEAKSRIAWKDCDTVLVGTDFGPGSLTRSGYPRQVRRWARGTPVAAAPVLLEGDVSDVSVGGFTSFRPEGSLTLLSRSLSFFEDEASVLEENGSLRRIPFPPSADLQGVFQGQILALLRKEWRGFPSGALVSMPVNRLDPSAAELVFSPDARTSITGVTETRSSLYLGLLENVKGRLVQVTRSTSGGWKVTRLGLPEHGMLRVASADDFDDVLLLRFESFLAPSSIFCFDGGEFRALKQLPARFDAGNLAVDQFESTSADGTKIPYFLIRRKDLPFDGNTPTLLYGYGGFEIPLTPAYLGATGKVWLERGGAYAVANIRGGGEFGPSWHQAALKGNRQKAFDDFISVAEDLIRRKVTSPRRLGISGGSNGGLLVGAVFMQRPELFNAVVCSVPLLDMLRFHKLLAGASWMGEYGNPDNPADAAAIRRYSPYQNVKPGVKYPRVFILTSTKDDRVHPGHARKMVARLEALGQDVLYYENIEGGHGGAANLEQRVKKSALEFAYLFQQLSD